MKKFLSGLGTFFWTLFERTWLWLWLCYLAYTLVKAAPTPWHGQCVYFSIFVAIVLSTDVRDYVRDGVRDIEKEINRITRK